MLTAKFFTDDPINVAKKLLGKVIRVYNGRAKIWLSAMIIETEAYYIHDKASHSSLGYTEKRRALFMPPGTIYMYYAHGGDSLNISCLGDGNAVLIKSGVPFIDSKTSPKMLAVMQKLNPIGSSKKPRLANKLCSGQTLLCRSLGLKVAHWNQRQFDHKKFYIEDIDYAPNKVIQTIRLGIPKGRDEHLPYRFIDFANAQNCTSDPLRKKKSNFKILNSRAN